MTMILQDHVATVTGAASDMGAATARRLTEAGATVLGADIASNPQVALIGDVAESAFCDVAVDKAVALHSRIYILVNAAGVVIRADAPATDDDACYQDRRARHRPAAATPPPFAAHSATRWRASSWRSSAAITPITRARSATGNCSAIRPRSGEAEMPSA